MTTTATTTTTAPSAEMPALARQLREHLLASVTQGQNLTIDAAQSWAQAVAALPVPALPSISGAAIPRIQAATHYTVDLATDLFNAQRDFALQLTDVLVPDSSH